MESGDRHVSDHYVKGLKSGNLTLKDVSACLPPRGPEVGPAADAAPHLGDFTRHVVIPFAGHDKKTRKVFDCATFKCPGIQNR